MKNYFCVLLILGIMQKQYAQYFNSPFIFNHTNTFEGSIIFHNNSIYVSSQNLDTSCKTRFCISSVFTKFSNNGTIVSQNIYRPLNYYAIGSPLRFGKSKLSGNNIYFTGSASDTFDNNYVVVSIYDTSCRVQKFISILDLSYVDANDIQLVNNTNFIIGGASSKAGFIYPYYLKIDTSGNILYRRIYDTLAYRNYNYVWAKSIIALDSGNSLLVCEGIKYDPGPFYNGSKYATVLIKVDSLGNELWHKILPDTNMRAAYSFQKTSDGGYISCGAYMHYRGIVAGERYAPLIIKWGSNFAIEWSYYYNENKVNDSIHTNAGELYDIVEQDDGSFITCGFGGETNQGVSVGGGLIQKISSDGHLLWNKYYNSFRYPAPISSHYLYDLDVLPNGDLAAVGEINPNDGVSVSQQGWLLRVDSNGCIVDSNWCGFTNIEVEPIPQSWQGKREIEIYPNPATDNITIRIPFIEPAELNNASGSLLNSGSARHLKIELYDALGRSIKYQIQGSKSNTNEIEYTLNIKESNAGMYFIRIVDKDNKFVGSGKFVKE